MNYSEKQSSSRSRSSQPSNASSSSTFGISENSTRVIISPSGGRHRRKASPERSKMESFVFCYRMFMFIQVMG